MADTASTVQEMREAACGVPREPNGGAEGLGHASIRG